MCQINILPSKKANTRPHHISNLLLTYHNVLHTTTGISPAHLVLVQAPRTDLSMTSPSVYIIG